MLIAKDSEENLVAFDVKKMRHPKEKRSQKLLQCLQEFLTIPTLANLLRD